MTIGYTFPADITLDEVRELIKDNHNFIIVDKGDYIVVNYVRAGNDTFPSVVDRNTAILRELRGLIFSPEGKVIARRFHKFFNYGEREDLLDINVNNSHRFIEKLDGSMITPIPLPGGHIRWGTKMGLTEVGMQAEVFVSKNKNYQDFAQECVYSNVTPIFEWCSRQQRIVVDYPEDKLVLLAVRDNKCGFYYSRDTVFIEAQKFNIPIVNEIIMFDENNFETKIKKIREWETDEGVVVTFDNGHMVKIKADAYVSLHRAKSLLDNERDVVELILDEKEDDLYPLLNNEDKIRLTEFNGAVWTDIENFNSSVNITLTSWSDKTRKEYALETKDGPLMRSFVFTNWDKKVCVWSDVVEYVKKHLGSAGQFEKCAGIFKTAKWNGVKE